MFVIKQLFTFFKVHCSIPFLWEPLLNHRALYYRPLYSYRHLWLNINNSLKSDSLILVQCLLTDATWPTIKSVKCRPDFQLWMSWIIFAVWGPKVTSFCSNLQLDDHIVGKISRVFQICQQICFSCSGGWAICTFSDPLVTSHLQGGFHLPTSFTSVVHELCFACSWITLILDTTIWLDGARPANPCIPPSFPWMAPVHCLPYPTIKVLSPLNQLLLPGYVTWCQGAIQGKEGRIQVLAGLAPSSQTVGSNIRVILGQVECSSWMT
jgi:hypothetical protein